MKKSFLNIKKIAAIARYKRVLNLGLMFLLITLSLNDIFAQAPPAAPGIKPATSIRNDRFVANWDQVTDATGYYLDVSTDIAFTNFVTGFNNLNLGDILKATVSGLTANTEYFYRVRAYNSNGTGINSQVAELFTGPSVPHATAATSITQVNFVANWDSVGAASGYYLDLATDSLFTHFVDNYNNRNAGTHFKYTIDSVLTPGTIYYYRVRAFNSNGLSNNSNKINVKTLPIPPSAPVNLAATNVQVGRVLLSWNNNTTSEIGFKIERRSFGLGDFIQIDTAANGSTNYLDNTVAENAIYDYRIKSYNSYYESGYSNIASITTLYNNVSPPSNLKASVAAGKVVLTWTVNSYNETGFNIERKTASQSSFSLLNRAQAHSTGYSDNSVSENVTYSYRVNAFNINTASDYSNVATVTTSVSTLNAPSNLTASAPQVGWVVLSWTDNSTNESGFKVERKLSTETNFIVINSVGQNSTTYWDSTIAPKKSYDYRVKAYTNNSESGYSNVATVTSKVSGIARFGIPVEYSLEQNFPNPFNPSTVIRFSLPKSSFVKLTIYNILGEAVMNLINEELTAGYYYQDFIGINLPSGIYIYALSTKEFYQTKKMILIK